MQSGIEDHTFGPTNVRENFPDDEFTLGKNKCALLNSNRISFLPLYSLQQMF